MYTPHILYAHTFMVCAIFLYAGMFPDNGITPDVLPLAGKVIGMHSAVKFLYSVYVYILVLILVCLLFVHSQVCNRKGTCYIYPRMDLSTFPKTYIAGDV